MSPGARSCARICGFLSRGGLPGSQLCSGPGSFFCHRTAILTSRRASISTNSIEGNRGAILIQAASVVANRRLCREHYCITLRVNDLPDAEPGQFVHISPENDGCTSYRTCASDARTTHNQWTTNCYAPLLRRAFSIAGLSRAPDGVSIDVIYRVVGTATHWLESLKTGDGLSVLGPLGNRFPVSEYKPLAWLVAGGVGLPPMLWLAEALHHAGKRTVALCGAQTADLLALTVEPGVPPAADATCATLCCREFAKSEAAAVISTDDGSLGFQGHIGAAMAAYHDADPVTSEELVVYTCGPEPMMRFVAEYCIERDIECQVCMERTMACGTGLCQSCVVPIRDNDDPDGWSYRLCCTYGPIFDAASIIWEPADVRQPDAGRVGTTHRTGD